MYTDDAQAFADSQMNFGGMDSNDEKEQKNNLIVNYIPVYMSQDDLHKLFAPYGNIISCKLIVDKNTGMSLGYGFIKFSDESEAEKAIQHLNGHHIGGKSLKVSAARPPNGKLNERTTVYIAGFPTTWTKAELEALVRPFGKLMESKILNDQQGKSRGVGFVRFETNGQAASAIHGLNGTLPAGGTKTLQAKLAQYPISSGKRVMQQRVQMQMGALFGVNPLVQNARGKSPVTPYARPAPAVNMGFDQSAMFASAAALNPALNPTVNTFGQQSFGQDLGFGNFGFNQQAAAANFGFGQDFNQAGFGAVQAPLKTQQPLGVCLFIYHLPQTATEDRLYQLFSPYGQIVNVKIMRDLTLGVCKGYGFVNMATLEQATLAMNALNNYNMDGKYLKISFKTDKNK
eukprot:TRINITY_DN119_c0_g1_i12.p2 TRINITY_DN119_c0_g1~~TRINITY_DN119_c0_g1_i12.p2  ORF type:complete len:419 (+),score=191.86 TRINITY_DN119_c0_g1_i12:56-1258(+)